MVNDVGILARAVTLATFLMFGMVISCYFQYYCIHDIIAVPTKLAIPEL